MIKGFILGMLTFLTLIMVSGCSMFKPNTEYKDLPNHDHIKCTGECNIKLK